MRFGPSTMGEERRRHLVVLRVGGVGVLGDRTRRHLRARRRRRFRHRALASRVAVRAQSQCDRGADDDVGQRHAFGGADDGGDKAHRQRSLVRRQRKERAGTRLIVAIALAARAQHLLFQRRNAGDVDQDPVHEDRRQQRGRSPRDKSADDARSPDRPASRTIRRSSSDAATSATARHRRPALVGGIAPESA